MRIKKDFGDTLIPGKKMGTVAVHIVRINLANGTVTADMELTSRIEIIGDDYVQLGMPIMNGSYLCATVTAPVQEHLPADAVVSFRLCGGGGMFENRMHFKVRKAQIIFAQENLTLPANYDETVRLPFMVDGLYEPEVSVEISGNIDESNPTYEVEVEYDAEQNLHYAVITEKQKEIKQPAGFCDIYTLRVKACSGEVEIEGELPLYRYVMGLRADILGNVGCYLEEYDPARHVAKRPAPSADGKCYVPAETKMNVKPYDYDMENHKLIVWSPGLMPNGQPADGEAVLTGYKLIPEEENRTELVKHLHLRCDVRDSLEKNDSGAGRLCVLSCQDAVLDTPTRINATIELTAQMGERTYTVQKKVRLLSQPLRPFSADDQKNDEKIYDGLQTIRQHIWDNGWYNNLFPLVHLIDTMTDGYSADFGYDRSKVKLVQNIYMGFLSGDIAGANAQSDEVTFGDELRMAIESFAETTNSVSEFTNSIPGLMGRLALGFVTLGGSEVVFEGFDLVAGGVKMGQGVIQAVENGDDKASAVLTVGAKVWASEAVGRLVSAGAKKVLKSQPVVTARNAVMKEGADLVEKGKNFFSGTRAKSVINATNQSKAATAKAVSVTKSLDKVSGATTSMSADEVAIQKAFESNQALAKTNIDDLQAAIWLYDQNPTVANLKLRNQLVARCQQSKSTIYMLQNYANTSLDGVRKEFNAVMKDFHDSAAQATCEELSALTGVPMYKIKRFKATSASQAKVKAGKKVPVDSDTTFYYEDSNGEIHYFDEKQVQEIYDRKLYHEVQFVEAPDQKIASRYAQKLDSTVIEDVHGNAESYGDDVLRMTQKDLHKQALTCPEKVADAVKYKLKHWHAQSEAYLKQA